MIMVGITENILFPHSKKVEEQRSRALRQE